MCLSDGIRLEEEDRPEVVVFMGNPDVISGLFTWVNFDSTVSDAVIAPFGARVYFHNIPPVSGTDRRA